jgi:ABC-type uncharacterized transport system ATPase subunit
MRDRRKRAQREEVRKVLHEMRLELAAQRVAQEQGHQYEQPLRINEFLVRTRRIIN